MHTAKLLEVSLHHLFHIVEQQAFLIGVPPVDVRFAKGGCFNI